MNHQIVSLEAGLYLVATPIGSARDITLRALDLLASADVIAAEDTRTTRKLMEIHGIPTKGRTFVPYHDHNGAVARPRLLSLIAQGQSVAYASDAGTPLVADPGFALARDAIAQGLYVTSAPGPSAVLAALALAGLPTDRFTFAGFAPPSEAARRAFLSDFSHTDGTLVFFESAKRVQKFLSTSVQVFGETRPACVCRELTKKFEDALRGSLDELLAEVTQTPLRGEVVVVIGPGKDEAPDMEQIEKALVSAMERLSVKDASAEVASSYGLRKRDIYQMALAMKQS